MLKFIRKNTEQVRLIWKGFGQQGSSVFKKKKGKCTFSVQFHLYSSISQQQSPQGVLFCKVKTLQLYRKSPINHKQTNNKNHDSVDYVCKITTERTTRLVEQCPLDRYLATALHLGKSKHCKSTQSAQTPHTVKSTVNSCVSQSIVDLNRSFLQQLKLGIKQVYNRKAEKEMTQGAAIIPWRPSLYYALICKTYCYTQLSVTPSQV